METASPLYPQGTYRNKQGQENRKIYSPEENNNGKLENVSLYELAANEQRTVLIFY